MKTHRAFTMAELIVSLLIMAITYSAMTLSMSTTTQTAEHEAERLAAYIYRTIDKADRIHTGFKIDMDFEDKADGSREYYVTIVWVLDGREDKTDKSFRAWKNCKYSDSFQGTPLGELEYNVKNRKFQTGGTITVTDSEGKMHYVIIAADEGRIRLSDTPPE